MIAGIVKVIDPGFYSSIQDMGRFGFATYGVPFSGAMDQNSFRLANALLNNEENDACIEWVYRPPILQFSKETVISVTGAMASCFLNGNKINLNCQVKVNKNDIFSASFCKNYKYGYVGIVKGFMSDMRLNSRSFYHGVTQNGVLKKDDEIDYQECINFTEKFSSISSNTLLQNSNELLVYRGPEFVLLSNDQKHDLLNTEFTISSVANRMALQLTEQLPNNLPSILTSPVLPGTIQLTPSGKMIVLMRDCQTTGGYPRILQLSQDAISAIVQKRASEKCTFKLIS
ncbi:biotin-dependent carboxyltransferase family protein [Aquimarina gracilis]|uniref:Biotin-dependent carboxyltransferase family protein n=1 Tax=Aquimarina gracilis TaxID=874422 RepID=A0ABU5ZVE2_9FLAO|nr:biotin-dependent carboxyltransferase family protein [Aquimarina gracilis]MEB3345692.1 biotin-dependent carboxyltransferase family protein [Aquimarina gracilis]